MSSPLRSFPTPVARAFAVLGLLMTALCVSAKADEAEKFSCAGSYDDWWVVISPTPRSPAADASEHEITVPVVPVHWTGTWPKGLQGAWGWRIPQHTCITPLLPQPMVDASCPQGWMTVSVTKDDLYQRSPRDETGVKLIPGKEYVLDADQTAVQICSAYLGRVKHLMYATTKLPDSCYGPSPNWMNVGWYYAREDERAAKMYDHVVTVPSTVDNGDYRDWVGYREITRPVYGKARYAIYATRCPYAGIGYVPGWAGNPYTMYGNVAGLPNQTAAYEVKVDIGFKGRFQKYGNYYNIYFPGFDRGLNYNPPVIHSVEKSHTGMMEKVVQTPTGIREPMVMGNSNAGLYQAYGYAKPAGNYKVSGAATVAVRAGASVNSQKIGSINQGAMVNVADARGVDGPGCRGGVWLRIYAERGTGFVCSVYLHPTGGGTNYRYNMNIPPENGALWGHPGRAYMNNRGPDAWWSNYLPYVTQPTWRSQVPGGMPNASVEIQREFAAGMGEKKTD